MKLKCNKCLELKDTGSFSVDNTKKRGYQYTCKDCHNKYTRDVWYVKNQEKQKSNARLWKQKNRSRVLAKKYNTSIDTIETLIESMSGNCPICNSTMERPHLDHNHNTGQVRDFICSRCNIALGMTGENVTTLRNLIAYIDKHTLVAQGIE